MSGLFKKLSRHSLPSEDHLTVSRSLRVQEPVRRKSNGCHGSGGGGGRRRLSDGPEPPPSPTQLNLTSDELQILSDVFSRQERFEQQEAERIKQLEREVLALESQVKQQQNQVTHKRRPRHIDLRLCRLCFKTKFADGIGRACYDCKRRVCARCGSFNSAQWEPHRQRYTKTVWRCTLCQRRRRLACASGKWFHGHESATTPDSVTLRRKLSDVTIESDWGFVDPSDSPQYSSYGPQSDSELASQNRSRDDSHRSSKRYCRRRHASVSTEDAGDVADEDDQDVDDEQFLLERQKCRQERLQMQRKMVRKKPPRKSSVGTSTQEDGILADNPPREEGCPLHGPKPALPQKCQLMKGSSKRITFQSDPNIKDSMDRNSRFLKDKRSSSPCIGSPQRAPAMKLRQRSHSHSPIAVRSHLEGGQRRRLADTRQVSADVHHSSRACSPVTAGAPPQPLPNPNPQAQPSSTRGRLVRTDTVESASEPLKFRPSAHGENPRQPVIAHVDGYTFTLVPDTAAAHSANSSMNSVFTEDSLASSRLGLQPVIKQRSWAPSDSGSSSRSDSQRSAQSSCRSAQRLGSSSLSHERCRGSVDYLRRTVGQSALTDNLSGSKDRGMDATHTTDVLYPDNMVPKRKLSGCQQFRVVLEKDKRDSSCRTLGLGMRVVGGKQGPDGRLGAFVTHVVLGSQADLHDICEGDQILEWDGSSLQDATFEETRQILDRSGDTVQLVVMHTREERRPSDTYRPIRLQQLQQLATKEDKGETTPQSEATPTATSNVTTQSTNVHDAATTPAPPSTTRPTKRLLPKPPTERVPQAQGKLRLRLWHDSKACTLSVAVIQAEDLATRPGPERERPCAFTKVRLLSQRSRPIFRTVTVENSKEPEWNQTFVFEDITSREMLSRTLEVTLWDAYTTKQDSFLGELLLDLAQANTQNTSVWYPLGDHDENAGPLPGPSPKPGTRSIQPLVGCTGSKQSWRSLPVIPATPAHDMAKALLHRRNSPGRPYDARANQTTDISSSTGALPKSTASPAVGPDACYLEELILTASTPDDSQSGAKCSSKMAGFRRRVSYVMNRVGAKFMDRRSRSFESKASPNGSEGSDSKGGGGRRHSVTVAALTSLRSDLLGPAAATMSLLQPSSGSRNNSMSSGSHACSSANSDNEMEELSRLLPSYLRPAPDGDDITSMLGPGQLPPKPSLEKLVQGDIKLGFMITKGQLEIDVICAKGLSLGANKLAPDTYVKTYLVGNGKRLQKRRTKTAKESTDPLYRQKLKYSACNVHGRLMQIIIKEKTSGFDRNQCMGEVAVKLDNLDLGTHTMGWYKLFKESATDLGSVESL